MIYIVFVECYLDVELVESLDLGKRIDHSGSIAQVLIDIDQIDEPVYGIIDEDPNQGLQPRLANYELLYQFQQLKLFHKPNKSEHRVIIIPYQIENWLFRLCDQEDIDFGSYRVLNFKNELKKRYQGDQLSRFRIVLQELQSNPSIQKLKEWLATDQLQ